MIRLFGNSLFVALLLCITNSLDAQIIYVNTNAPGGGDGSSWASAYRDLQSALIDTQNGLGDEIWVAQGSYFITGTADTYFEIPSAVAVYGGFLGIESARDSRDWQNNKTILDGANTYHTIVYFENSSNITQLDGFTIQNGNANGTTTVSRSGAGIFINTVSGQNASPQIKNCTIKDNYADSNGGAIYIDGSNGASASPVFENCSFENNECFSDGGAIYVSGISNGVSTPSFEKCTFKNNFSVGSGGAIFCHGGNGNVTMTINKCNFEFNTAEGNGGALYSLGTGTGSANHSINNSRFYANDGFAAGAIYNNGGSGGNCSPTITNCTFYLNEATGNGGTGGAIYNNGSNGGNSSPLVSNCIIHGNIGPFGSQVFRNINGSPLIRYSLVDVADCNALDSGEGSNVSCGSGMIFNQNPAFENTVIGDLRLQAGSPAIDTGNDTDNSESEDLDCSSRNINTIDMGAYEAPDVSLPVELAFFEAYLETDKVILMWTSLTEENNALYSIERSIDGRNFETLSTVNGAGNSTQARNYQSFDFHPYAGVNYYRLKTTSYSGELEYSLIKSIVFSPEKISAFPNPAKDEITIQFSNFKQDQAQFTIFDIYGKEMYSSSLQVENNISFIALDEVSSFVPGFYILKVYSPRNGSFNYRFQKIRD